MANPTSVASTLILSAPVAAPLADFKLVQACQTLAQAESRDLVEICDILPSIEDPIALRLDGWQDPSSLVLKVPEPKLASNAVMVANHFESCLGMHLPSL